MNDAQKSADVLRVYQIVRDWISSVNNPRVSRYADDLAQDAYFLIQRSRESWRPDGGAKFETYALRVVRSTLFRSARAYDSSVGINSAVLRDVWLDDPVNTTQSNEPSQGRRRSLLDCMPSDVDTFEIVAAKRAVEAARIKIAERTNSRNRTHVETTLRILGDESQSDVARALGISREAVSQRVQKGRAVLAAVGRELSEGV